MSKARMMRCPFEIPKFVFNHKRWAAYHSHIGD
jgi:hypothetical protein